MAIRTEGFAVDADGFGMIGVCQEETTLADGRCRGGAAPMLSVTAIASSASWRTCLQPYLCRAAVRMTRYGYREWRPGSMSWSRFCRPRRSPPTFCRGACCRSILPVHFVSDCRQPEVDVIVLAIGRRIVEEQRNSPSR